VYIGKVLYNFEQLKEKYIFSYFVIKMIYKLNAKLKDWPKITNEFIKQLITYLDSSVCLDRDLKLEVICCIEFSEAYCKSHICNQEISFADSLALIS